MPRERIFVDKRLGEDFDREDYRRMVEVLREGDLVFVLSIDCLVSGEVTVAEMAAATGLGRSTCYRLLRRDGKKGPVPKGRPFWDGKKNEKNEKKFTILLTHYK